MKIEEESAMLNRPDVANLTLENISLYAANIQHAPLTNLRKEQVQAFLVNNKSALNLNALLTEFTDMYKHYSGLAGLTPKETERLRELVAVRTAFKKSHIKGEYDGPAFRRFISNEQKIVSFNKSMQWWQTNIETLRKLELWENLNSIIISNARNQKLSPSELSKLQHKLADVKNEWSRQQIFAAYSSSNLLLFYKNYLCTMEETLSDVLADSKDYPKEVTDYLFKTLYNVKEMRKQAIYSMIERLNTMEENDDIESDDILHRVIKRIDSECGINLDQNGKRPDPRKGLTTDSIDGFVAAIQSYIDENPEDKIISSELSKHSTFARPYSWSTFSDTVIKNSRLAKSPIITFIFNKLPGLLTDVDIQRNISTEILTTENLNAESFILTRIQKMIAITHEYLDKYSHTEKNKLDEYIISEIEKYHVSYGKQIQDIYTRISVAVRNATQQAVNNAFSNEPFNYEHLVKLSQYLARSEEFDRKLLKSTYDPDKDIILAVSAKLKQMIEKGVEINEQMIEKISNLLLIATDNTIKMDDLKKHLQQLPAQIRSIHVNDDPYIMHYITHQIEANLLTDDSIETALKRHEYIADLYSEKWEKTASTPPENMSACNQKVWSLQQYIHTVFIPLIQQSPSITLDNFSDNHIADVIKDLCKKLTNDEVNCGLPELYKSKFESEVLIKIDNLFSIKQYLYQSSNSNINIEKLHGLILKVNDFFTDHEPKTRILSTIQNAACDLTKNYLINIIQNNIEPDFEYISKISVALKIDTLALLSSDSDITRLLTNYVNMYAGTTNNIGRLLVELAKNNANLNNKDMIYTYALKRLNYISSSHSVSQQDFYFFNYFKSQRFLSALLKTHRDKHLVDFPAWLTDKSTWTSQRAMLIELFGNEKDVDAYRFKRIRELLSTNIDGKMDDTSAKYTLDEFAASINHFNQPNRPLVNPRNIVTNRTTLSTYLDYASNSRSWSLILEMLIGMTGTEEQLQTLHYRFLSKQLGLCADISKSLVGQKFVNSPIDCIGTQNIAKLCAQIERSLTTLNAVNALTNQTELSNRDYHLYLSMISSLVTFKHFYMGNSSNATYKDMFQDLHELEQKIQLHQALHATIKSQTHLLSIANENTVLHNKILSLTKNVIDLEDGRHVTSDNVSYYVRFATNDILGNVASLLENKQFKLTLPILLTLHNLISQIPSNHLKLQLITAHKQDATEHPIWLTLINHMDEQSGMMTVINNLSHAPDNVNPGKGFGELLEFSRQFNLAKAQIHTLIKKELINIAAIPIHNPDLIDFDKLTQPDALSDKHLIKLWNAALSQIHAHNSESTYATPGIRYVIKLASKLGNELLLRSRHQPSLLKQFTESFLSLSLIYQQQMTPDTKNELAPSRRLSIWAPPPPSSKLLDPLILIAQRSVAMLLLQKLESFAAHHVPNKKMNIYDKICNDPAYLVAEKKPSTIAPIVKKSTSLTSDNAALAIAHTVPLYLHAQKSLTNNQPDQNLRKMVEELAALAASNPGLAATKDFKELTGYLVKLCNYNPMIQNDKEFTEPPTWKRIFSLSG